MFYWLRENEENCSGNYGQRPCLSPTFLSSASVIGYIFFVIGTIVYNRFASQWSYRNIWTITQIILVFLDILNPLKKNRD